MRSGGPPPGPVQVGDYTVLSRLGEGGMGVVHLARRGSDGHRVALKVLRPHVVGDEEARERLAREVASLSRVHSRRVAEVLDADPWGDVPYVVTRYVPGPSLHAHVAEEGPLVGADLDWAAWCLAEALADVHRAGVLHRDVKPTNVLLEGRSPVLIDFGLARVADDPRLTHTGWLLGTPGYLAPEVLHGEDATTASDVHSWAATVAFAATGTPPFGRGPAVAVMDRVRRGEHDLSAVPSPLREALRDALHPDPAARPTLDQLRGWLRSRVDVPARAAAAAPPAETVPEPLPVPPPPARVDEVPAAATRVLPVADASDGTDGADGPWPDWADQVPARAPRAQRWRAGALLLGLAALVGAALASYPWMATAVLSTAVVLVRAGARGGAVRRARREARGRRWWDVPLGVLSAPWHLVASLPGTLVLLFWATGIGLAGALLAYAFAPGEAAVLAAAGAAGAVGLWLGPGAVRLRGPVGGGALTLARRPGPWSLALVATLVLAAGLGAAAAVQGTVWSPATQDPVTALRGALDGLPGLAQILG
nr:serine/threonine-protein kinase [Nocardioides perillae]